MIDAFIDQNVDDAIKLENSYIANNFDEMKRIAHKMKTSVRLIGMSETVESALLVLEKYDTKTTPSKELQGTIDLVKSYCDRVILVLNAYKHSKG